MIQCQILQTSIIRIVWQIVKRVTDKILGVKGLRGSEYSKKYNEVKSAWTAKFNALFFFFFHNCLCIELPKTKHYGILYSQTWEIGYLKRFSTNMANSVNEWVNHMIWLTIGWVWSLRMTVHTTWFTMSGPTGVSNTTMLWELLIQAKVTLN